MAAYVGPVLPSLDSCTLVLVMTHRYLLRVPGTDIVPAITPAELPWLETLLTHALKSSKDFPGKLWFIEKRAKGEQPSIMRVIQDGRDITTAWKDDQA